MLDVQDSIVIPINTTAPAAGAVLAVTPALVMGWYKVIVKLYLSGTGTPLAADADNARFQVGTTDKATINFGLAKDVVPPKSEFIFRALTNAATFRVVAVGTGTAAVEYRGSLCVTRIGD